jgi:hypothetical protein
VPTGTVKLNQDFLNLRGNFSQLDTTFGVDHTKFSNGTAQNGYHTTAHFIPFSTPSTNPPDNYPPVVPVAVSTIGELFCCRTNDGINTDSTLFFQSGGGRLMQLTRNLTILAANNGYTFIPGGFILQWGQITSVASTFQTLTFATNNIAFPNKCFCIFTQPYGTGTPPSSDEQATVDIRKSTVSATSFEWCYKTNSSQYTGFYWIALGN